MPSALIDYLQQQSGQHGKKGRQSPKSRVKIASEATPSTTNTACLQRTSGFETHRVANLISQATCLLLVKEMSKTTTTPQLPPVGSHDGTGTFTFELSVERGHGGQMLIVLDFYVNRHIANDDTSDPSEHSPSVSIAWLSAVLCHDQPVIHNLNFGFTQLPSISARGSQARNNDKQLRYTNLSFDSNVAMITDVEEEILQGVDDENVKETLGLLCFGKGPLQVVVSVLEEYEPVPLEKECMYMLRAAANESSPRHNYEAVGNDTVCKDHERELNDELQDDFRGPPSSIGRGSVVAFTDPLTRSCGSGIPCILQVNARGPLTGNLSNDAPFQPTVSFSQKPDASSPSLTISLSRPNGPPIAQTSWATDDRRYGAWSVQDASLVRTVEDMSDKSMGVLASSCPAGEEDRRRIMSLSFKALPQHLARCSKTAFAGANEETRRAMGVVYRGVEQYYLRVWFQCPAEKFDDAESGGLAGFMAALERREAPLQCWGNGEADVIDPLGKRDGRLQRSKDDRPEAIPPSERRKGSSRGLESDWVEEIVPDADGPGREKRLDLGQETLSTRADDSDVCWEISVDETTDCNHTTKTVIKEEKEIEANFRKTENENKLVEGDVELHASSRSLDTKRRWATVLLVLLIWNISPHTRLFN